MPKQGILIVDDEPHIRSSMRDLLEAHLDSVEVHLADGGEAGLRLLRTENIDLVVADYRMPGMHGLTFLENAQRIAPKAHRILMTAYPELDVALGGIRQGGIENFFAKPLDIPQVIDTMAAVLYERRAQFLRRRMLSRSFEQLKHRGEGGAPDSVPAGT